jgi:hypothetical protein
MPSRQQSLRLVWGGRRKGGLAHLQIARRVANTDQIFASHVAFERVGIRELMLAISVRDPGRGGRVRECLSRSPSVDCHAAPLEGLR